MFTLQFFTREIKKRIMLQIILDFLNMMESIDFEKKILGSHTRTI